MKFLDRFMEDIRNVPLIQPIDEDVICMYQRRLSYARMRFEQYQQRGITNTFWQERIELLARLIREEYDFRNNTQPL